MVIKYHIVVDEVKPLVNLSLSTYSGKTGF
jgi:hypothetical protein